MKIDEYDYKQAPQESDKILIQENIEGGNNYYTLINDIISKLSSSQINTSSKTLTGAINELNNKFGDMPSVVCNFNDPPNKKIFHADPGSTNYPPGLAGNAWVVIQQYPRNIRFSSQLVFGMGASKIAMRRKHNTTEWTEWEYFYPNDGGNVYVRSITNSDLALYGDSVIGNSVFVRSGRTVICTLGEVKTATSYTGSWNRLIHIPDGYKSNFPIYGIGTKLYGQPEAMIQISGNALNFVKHGNSATSGALTIFSTLTWITNDDFPT